MELKDAINSVIKRTKNKFTQRRSMLLIGLIFDHFKYANNLSKKDFVKISKYCEDKC